MSRGVLTIRVSRRRTSPSIFFRSLALTVCPSCNMSLVLLRWGSPSAGQKMPIKLTALHR